MAKKDKEKYGNVYEVKLLDERYVYVCWMGECNFGVFDYISIKPTNINQLLSAGIKIYKACKETAVKKGIWKLIGHIDLEKENLKWPDLVIFLSYDKEYFIECSRVMRDGNPQIVSKEYYVSLLKRGYIYGFFDNYQTFELWLYGNLEDYPENQDIFPLPAQYC